MTTRNKSFPYRRGRFDACESPSHRLFRPRKGEAGISSVGSILTIDHLDSFSWENPLIWKQMPDFLEYEVSEYGDVRRGGVLLKPERVHGNGRKRFCLSKAGRQFRFKAAQLVARAFIGPPPFVGAEVCHDDGFDHNNHYLNLRWDTHAANMSDVLRHKVQLRSNSRLFVSKTERLSVAAGEFLRANRA